jgi:hypothetical protein
MNSFPLDNAWNAEDPSAYVPCQNMRKVPVYKIPKGVDIDVQQIHGTHFGAPYIVDVNWSREKITHLSAFRKEDIVSEDYGMLVFAYPSRFKIDLVKNTVRESLPKNIPPDVKWVVRVERSLVSITDVTLIELPANENA